MRIFKRGLLAHFALVARANCVRVDKNRCSHLAQPRRTTMMSEGAGSRRMKAADLLVECLKAEGVKTVFALPGEENMDLALALEANNDSIKTVIVRHEQGAGFMANIDGKLNKCVPGVCLTTLGPGATNIVTAVADAMLDHAPMVLITAQVEAGRRHKKEHQVVDVRGIFESLTKWNATIQDPATIPEIIRQAFRAAVTEKPGPCHIELPQDVAQQMVCINEIIKPIVPKPDAEPISPDDVVASAFEIISKAKLPVILAGEGCIRNLHAAAALQKLCELTDIGVVTTQMGKGAIPASSKQYLGTVLFASPDTDARLLDMSDCLITVGFDRTEFKPEMWKPQSDDQRSVICIDSTADDVDSYFQTTVEVIGDITSTLLRLTGLCQEQGLKFPESRELCNTASSELSKVLKQIDARRDNGALHPGQILTALNSLLDENAIVLSDVGTHKLYVAKFYQAEAPLCILSNGLASMGVGLPGAIAAKLRYPDRKVVVVVGDGGFVMSMNEMETAVREGANIVCIVCVDGSYHMILDKQQSHFGNGIHSNLSFGNPDFVKLAEAFGWTGYVCNKSESLNATIKEALGAARPSLIAVQVDYSISPSPGNLSASPSTQ